jgi:carbonic anhydrase/acetyltransferase-like protein (isoleucine patch superfamily)
VAVYSLGDHVPHIPKSAYIAPGAIVIGKVTFGERTSRAL